uniref:F-box domain-containing protein n=1 Tax=Quercus lobata TaxID=97700 RepID=A0A7N2L6A9_QUELO
MVFSIFFIIWLGVAFRVLPSTLNTEIWLRKKTNISIDSIPELPCIILMDILSRLPITSILQYKCVCKTWFNIISDPYFAKLHFARAPVSLLFSNTADLSILDKRLYVLELEVCRRKPVTYVCNVITGEYMALPQPKNDGFKRRILGFCFSQTTNRYKLIQEICDNRWSFATQEHQSHQIEVCTLGTKKWRNIGDFPYSFPKSEYQSFCDSLNGALHWLVQPHNNTTFICHFDIENEQFKPFPGLPVQDLSRVRHMHLGVSGGFLYLCEKFLTSYSVEIWVMKDYGVKQSWTKEFVISNAEWTNSIWNRGPVQILNYGLYTKMETMEGAELYILHNSELSAYNAKRHERKIQVCGIDPFHFVIPYVPSLVTLKEAVIGESSQLQCPDKR